MNWWKNETVYQIYPRSFQDTNKDGIGDIIGIINRLDYLEELGIGVIWLSSIFKSPNFDNGYDVSDYKAVNPEYGTMEDLEELLVEADKRKIKVMMDIVLNHTSEQHAWFLEAKKGKDNPYRDYYVWRDSINGGVPNELPGGFGGSAWEYDEASEQYYLHLFSKHQPDLNWENPKMRQEIWDMMEFWIQKGVRGFRLDVVDLIGKVPDKMITVNGPKLHDYLQEMNRSAFGNEDILTVGEAWSASPESAKLYSNPERKELSMVFSFEHMVLDEVPGTSKWMIKPFTVIDLKRALAKWQNSLEKDGWNSLFWNNHDLPRIVSRWGNETDYRVESSKMFAILLHLLKGTPYIYQGEEIGMTNSTINSFADIDDIDGKMMYKEWASEGRSEAEILQALNKKGRDNARTPVQWDRTEQAGFSKGKPWMRVNKNYKNINVKEALENPDSIFYTYQKLIKLRKENPLVVSGSFRLLHPDHPQIIVYERSYEGEKWVVAANMSEEWVDFQLTKQPNVGETILSNYKKETYQLNNLHFRPFETFVVRNNSKNELNSL
ncbi:glycoside hydrolase family 13 protein [Carnobacterium sp.]|uniref:glycoside hydrolase family 13 protein n=1 Tax=Carnobacterium sp. TaxID=48221 RepID=UPI003C70FACB